MLDFQFFILCYITEPSIRILIGCFVGFIIIRRRIFYSTMNVLRWMKYIFLFYFQPKCWGTEVSVLLVFKSLSFRLSTEKPRTHAHWREAVRMQCLRETLQTEAPLKGPSPHSLFLKNVLLWRKCIYTKNHLHNMLSCTAVWLRTIHVESFDIEAVRKK